MTLVINLVMRLITRKLKNSRREIINTTDIYNSFIEEKKGNFKPHLLDLNCKNKRLPKKQITRKLFALIVLQYLKIYFNDLLFNNKDSYFFLGGRMKAALLDKRVRVKSEHMTMDSFKDNLSLVWYLRPSRRDYYIVSLKKARGSLTLIKNFSKIN